MVYFIPRDHFDPGSYADKFSHLKCPSIYTDIEITDPRICADKNNYFSKSISSG